MNAPLPVVAASAPDLRSLCLTVPALTQAMTIDAAADAFLAPDNARLLCLPVVDDSRVLGTISRHTLNGIFLRRFGRELYGTRLVTQIMNPQPLRVKLQQPIDTAARFVAARLKAPVTEDFVLEDDGRYAGMGIVVDLLAALQHRVDDAYRALQASQTQLVQSEKMASLGQMVAGVAHEINTPLGYVRNNVEVIGDLFKDGTQALAEHRRLLQLLTADALDETAITQQMQRCAEFEAQFDDPALLADTSALLRDTLHGVDTIRDLVVNLRNFARLDLARVDEVSLHDCLDQTLSIAHNAIKHRLQVIKRYGEIPPVRCSPSQINQVLLNLITNAAQAVPERGGLLLLRTEATEREVRVHVQDNGCGIAPEHLPRIFDPFFTTKAVGQGTGLGLSIAHQIAQAHGGRLAVVSKPGQGTKFVLCLPSELPEQLAA